MLLADQSGKAAAAVAAMQIQKQYSSKNKSSGVIENKLSGSELMLGASNNASG